MKKLISKRVKNFIQYIISSIFPKNNSIVIAGLGRSGTTLLYNSIAENHFYKKHADIIYFDDIEWQQGVIYKTHDFPPKTKLPDNVIVIFMFGNIYNTIISTHRKINEWSHLHHSHLRGDYKSNDHIFYEDTLKLEVHFDKWINAGFCNVEYEKLYKVDTQKRLSEKLGITLKMHPEMKRKTNYLLHPSLDAIKKTYGILHNKILQARK